MRLPGSASHALRTLVPAMAVLAGAAGMAIPAQANLITNPGFETGDLSGWTSGGTVFAGSNAYGYVSSHSGDWAAYFKNGTLSQTLATTPGANMLSLWLWGRGVTLWESTFSAKWAGQTVFMAIAASQDNKWYQVSVPVNATSSATVLEFDAVTESPVTIGFDWVLDDVSVELSKELPGPMPIVGPPWPKASPVPEPSTLVLLTLGSGVLGLVARRRRAS